MTGLNMAGNCAGADLLAYASVDPLTQQVNMTHVAGVLLGHEGRTGAFADPARPGRHRRRMAPSPGL
jgi:hypothetical protein